MSRSSDYITNLPTELLSLVFDDLKFEDLLEASIVCTRWFEILSDKRYIARHRLLLSPKLLDEENFNNLKRFRSVKILAKHFTNHQQILQQYLCNSEAVQILEELDIRLNATSWNDIFEMGYELNLPNVHTLHIFVPMDPNVEQIPCRIVAPNLKTFHQESNTICGPLELIKDQIESLIVDFHTKGHFLSTALGLSFANLRSLTLKAFPVHHFSYFSVSDTDFHSGYKSIFNRLDHLIIDELNHVESLAPVYSLIIREAKNVKSLAIYGDVLRQDILSEINQLKQLIELVLMITIESSTAAPNALSLPNLTKLKTLIRSPAPLTGLPNLKSLTIGKHERSFRLSHVLRDVEIAQIRSLAHQLKSFEIVNVELNDLMIDQICTFSDLRTLILKYVDVEPLGLVRMFSSLQNLKCSHFTECCLIKRIAYDSEDCDSNCNADDFWRDVCAKLSEVNIGCIIVATGGQILEVMTMRMEATNPEQLVQ